MTFKPDILLIGAQKAGTSSLASMINEHPEVTVSKPKEPHFFSQNFDRGWKWYENCFDNKDNLLLDASTSYTMVSSQKNDELLVPRRVWETNPNMKLIYIVRNPVDRTYSGYWHSVRNNRIKNKSFSELIRADHFDHLEKSDYYKQLTVWLNFFSLNNIKIVKFEDFQEAPLNTVKECFRFIGITEGVNVNTDSHRNKSFVPTNFGAQVIKRIQKSFLLKKVVSKVPRKMRTFVGRLVIKKSNVPKMTKEDRSYLVNHFLEKNRKFSELTGIETDDWNS